MTDTDWATLADRLTAWSDVANVFEDTDDDRDDLRAAAVGLRRLAQLEAAIEQHRTAHATEGHPGDEPWSCCNDDFYLWAVLGSGEQPEGPTP